VAAYADGVADLAVRFSLLEMLLRVLSAALALPENHVFFLKQIGAWPLLPLSLSG
jgi:hypothetical protein